MLIAKTLLIDGIMSAAEKNRLKSCELVGANINNVWTFKYNGKEYDRRKYISVELAELLKLTTVSPLSVVSDIERIEESLNTTQEKEFIEVWLSIYKKWLREISPYLANEYDLKKEAKKIAKENPEKIQVLSNEIQDLKEKFEKESSDISKKISELEIQKKSLGFFKKKEKDLIERQLRSLRLSWQDKKRTINEKIEKNEKILKYILE